MESEDPSGGRCGFVLEPDDVDEYIAELHETGSDEWYAESEAVCCWREVWDGGEGDRCIWHADTEDKPADELVDARADSPERLDGAYVPAVDLGDAIDFDECRLWAATFDGTDLRGASFAKTEGSYSQFSEADLSRVHFSDTKLQRAQFPDADLSRAQFPDADLSRAQFPDADLPRAEFSHAELRWAEFPDADLSGVESPNVDFYEAKLPDADLSGAQFPNANCRFVQLSGADLSGAQFPEAELVGAQFPDANLPRSRFVKADLSDAQFTDADLTEADLSEATIRQANFESAEMTSSNLCDSDLRGVNFYEATLNDVSINRRTKFGVLYQEPKLESSWREELIDLYESASMRRVFFYSIYIPLIFVGLHNNMWKLRERLSSIGREVFFIFSLGYRGYNRPGRLEKDAWTFRRIEQLSDDAGLSKQARLYNVQRKDNERRLYLVEDGSLLQWTMAMLSSLVMRYGESPWRVVFTSLAVIFSWSLLYPRAGGIRATAGQNGHVLAAEQTLALPDALVAGLEPWLTSFYFSVVTFTTLGYGDLQPATSTAQLLATAESFIGALLMALLVYVLGRRATW